MEDSENKPCNESVKSVVPETKQEATTSIEKKIISQIEHYFGDYNMCSILISEKNKKKIVPDDKFLQEAFKSDDGWVSIDTMLKFKRLAELTKNPSQILAALKKSPTGLIEVTGEGDDGKIRRSPSHPLPQSNPEDFKKEVEGRTIYVEGFDKETTTLDDVTDYFHGAFKNVMNINMMTSFVKKTKERQFKGSVFVTFKDKKSAKKLVKAESVEYKGVSLIRKLQKDYFKDKIIEREQETVQMQENKAIKAKENVSAEKEGQENEFTLPKGATLQLSGLGGEIMREDIRRTLSQEFGVNVENKGGEIAFLFYNKGDEEAKVRFKAENSAIPISEKWNEKEKVEIKEREISCKVMEGEEEEKFLASCVNDYKERRNTNRQKRKGGFHGGHGGKRGRSF